MIDFIKVILKDVNVLELENNHYLDFYDNINLFTGEIKTTNRSGQRITPYKKAEYKNLEFRIYSNGTITLSGSLHKYYNDGKHNFNDFDTNAVIFVLNDLKHKFNISPQQCILKCLELGINIIPHIPVNEILESCLLHKTSLFEFCISRKNGKYKQVVHQQYIVKNYNKALQYKSKFGLTNEILRFEIKYTKMPKLNSKGIFSIHDLLQYGLNNFKTELITEWKNILYFEKSIQINPLAKKVETKLLKYSNPNYWTGLIENNQRSTFYKNKKDLISINLKFSVNNKQKIESLISEKIEFLNAKST